LKEERMDRKVTKENENDFLRLIAKEMEERLNWVLREDRADARRMASLRPQQVKSEEPQRKAS